MTVTPSGYFSCDVYLLQNLIAHSETFRQVIADYHYGGTPIAIATARDFVHATEPEFDNNQGVDPNPHIPPYAIVDDDAENTHFTRLADAWGSAGTMCGYIVGFYLPVPADEAPPVASRQNASYWMRNTCGAIMKDMNVLAGTDPQDGGIPNLTHFNMIQFSKLEGPIQLDSAEYGITDIKNGAPDYLMNMDFMVEGR